MKSLIASQKTLCQWSHTSVKDQNYGFMHTYWRLISDLLLIFDLIIPLRSFTLKSICRYIWEVQEGEVG